MIVREKPPDSRIERQIITGMVISNEYLQQILPIYTPTSLRSPYTQIIAKWCQEYFEKYKIAPGRHIQDLFLSYKKNGIDPDQIHLIETFLADISDEYEQGQTFNVKYILDKTEKYFRQNSLQTLKAQLTQSIAGGRVEDAEALIAGYNRVVRPITTGIEPITDKEAIIRAFDPDSGDQMFQLPGDLGKMLGPFGRGMFVIIVGPPGKGKSWWLQEIGLRGLLAGFNVFFVSLEMSEKQITRRIHHNLSGLPKSRWKGDVSIPIFDCENKECTKRVMGNSCTKCKGDNKFKDNFQPMVNFIIKNKKELLAGPAISKGQALYSTLMRKRKLKLISPPPNSMKISDLTSILNNWEYYEGWIPDIIITDFSDKFAPEDVTVKEWRHRLYQTIIAHKALAMTRNCLVVSASQSNTGRDDSKKIKSGDFAEDIRKKAEVDIAFSLNQTPEDKEKGIMRISPMKIRDDDFNPNQECMVLQQLRIGRPYLDSYLLT